MSDFTLIDHIRELRRRLLWSVVSVGVGVVGVYVTYDLMVGFFMAPFLKGGNPLVIHSLLEGFVTRFKFSLLGGMIVSLPVHLFHLVRFVFPGLTLRERRLIAYSLLGSVGLAIMSGWLGYRYFIPFVVSSLLTPEFVPHGVLLMLNYEQSVFYVLNFLLWGILTFQLPVLLEVLLYLNVISRRFLLVHTRAVVVVILIIAAVVTPPDVVSQLMIALPLMGLYGVTILIAKLAGFGEGRV